MKLRAFPLMMFMILLLSGFASARQTDSTDTTSASSEPVGTEGLGEGMTAKEMIDYYMDLARGETSHGVMEMQVVTPDWDRMITMEWWEKGEERFLIRVLSPARDRGNGTLKIENNLWNYIFAFDETVHIPPAMMMQSWMGSDFTNDDVVRDASLVNDYEHELEGIEEIDGIRCYSILMTADPSTPVPWLTIRTFLRTEDLLPVRQEYYDDDGGLARYMIFSDFDFLYDRVIPTTMRMVPLDKEGHYTEMRYIEAEFDIEIPDDMFTLPTLENPDNI